MDNPIDCTVTMEKSLKKHVKVFCQRNKIKMIRCRSYNPRAQGKVERSHKVLKQKITYGLVTQ